MHLMRAASHYGWDNLIPPAVTVGSGDELTLDLIESSGGQITRSAVHFDVSTFDLDRVNPVTGPIAVAGAQPGDALAVSILDLDVDDWGWSANIPGFGLLADQFPHAYLALSQIDEAGIHLPFGVRLDRVPMIGTIGVAPPEPGLHPILPPRRWGGNLDVRHITRGSRILLPVGVDGAMLSIGDAHGAMGDGEVCGTGVETGARVRIRVEVVPGRVLTAPRYTTDPSSDRVGPAVATTGVGPDLMRASVDAASAMIDEIVHRTGLSPVEAYVLASLAGDLKISEIVDGPNWVVSMHMPLKVLE